MEFDHYNNLYNYLKEQKFPETYTSQQNQQLKNQSKYFLLKNNFIYKKDKRKDNHLLRVIRRHEMEQVLYMFHNDTTAAHFAVDTMFEKIRSRYYCPQLYENIRTYVKSCDSCQRKEKS